MMSSGIYSVSDKALFDALNLPKVTNSDLKQIFFSRGILIAKDTPRKELAKYFSRFAHSYDDFEMLTNVLGSTRRRERVTSSVIEQDIERQDLENAAFKLKEKIESEGAVADVSRAENGDIEINVRYTKLDLNRSEMRQSINKEARIVIEKEKGAVLIRNPLNDTVEQWKTDFLDSLSEELGEEIAAQEIDLSYVSDPAIKTKFFVELIKRVGPYVQLDVTDAYVYHPKVRAPVAEGGDEEFEQEGAIDLGVHISKASLKGEGVLESKELKSLCADGFYLWKISWKCKDSSYDSDIYEIEAQFSDPDNFRGFSYIVKGIYKYKEGGVHNTTRTALSKEEEKRVNKLVEVAARDVITRL